MSSRERFISAKTPQRPRKLQNSIDIRSPIDEDKRERSADTLQSMLKQERSGHYNCLDYLGLAPRHRELYRANKGISLGRLHEVGAETRVDEYCREQIVEWSFRVVDHFCIDREVVALSVSFLDRFLSNCYCDRTSFKLAATTTLNLAVKLLYPCKLGDLGILSDLSRGEFDMVDVAVMENCVLRSLSWHLHPPTPVAFTTILLDYVSCDLSTKMSSADLGDVYDVSSFFCDLAVCDYFFVHLRPSEVAFAAIENALEGMFGPKSQLDAEVVEVAKRLGIFKNDDVTAARDRLWELYERSEEYLAHSSIAEEKALWKGGIFVKKVSSISSPVSISTSCSSSTARRKDSTQSKFNQLVRTNTSW